ncbi:MAG: RNA polymerase sigma factor (sigma-70 family) [Pseudohongiellaceae bacterium]|jgi:RNA polymerase sigma factor (sigma-70 family)
MVTANRSISSRTLQSQESRRAWAQLRRWLGSGHEDLFHGAVISPAHSVACGVLKDRAEAWDTTLEAFDRLLVSLSKIVMPSLAGACGETLQRKLGQLVTEARVDGEPLLFAFLRARLSEDVRSAAETALKERAQTPVPISVERSAEQVNAESFSEARDPLIEAERHECVDRVQEAVSSLKGKLRVAQRLSMDGLSQRQIAKTLELSRGAVRWRLEQANQILSEKLGQAYGEFGSLPV